MKGLRQEGRSLREIATSLNGSDIRSKRGGIWHPQTVARVLAQSEKSVSELDTTTQAKERHDIVHVGGYNDQVFRLIADVASGRFEEGHWVRQIEAVKL